MLAPSLVLEESKEIAAFSLFKSTPPPTPPTYSIYPIPQRITVSHADGFQAGTNYGTNYSSATLFLAPIYQVGHVLPFLDGRVHRIDDNTYAANVGIGGRFIPRLNTFCYLFGFNAYYDYRRGHNWNYNQLSAGIEILGRFLDLRANVFFPIGSSTYSVCCTYDQYLDDWFATQCKCESVSFGYNAEIGYLFWQNDSIILYAATGPYYFTGKCLERTAGWEFRFRPQYQDYAALDLRVNYDRLYHTVWQATFIVSLPLYQIFSKEDKHAPCGITDRQVYQPVIRPDVMPISRSSCWHTNFNDTRVDDTDDDGFDDDDFDDSNLDP